MLRLTPCRSAAETGDELVSGMNEGCDTGNRLIVICGLSFAGKSTLGAAICSEFGHAQVDVDETKDEIFGPGVNDDEDLSPKEWTRIYTATDDKIVSLLRNGHSVVDASRNFRLRTIPKRLKLPNRKVRWV